MWIACRLSILAPLLLAAPALAQDPTTQPATITVTGSGKAELKPDFARIQILVSTQAEEMQQAVDLNRAATDRVIARLQSIGVKRDDIQTGNFQTFPRPIRSRPEERESRYRYVVNHQLHVTTRDIENIGRLAGEIAAIEGVNFQSLTWDLDRKNAGIDLARRDAVQDARRQAELYADAAGVKLGRLLEIRDGVAQIYGHNAEVMRSSSEAMPIVPPAMLKHTATIQMTWEIAP